MRGQNSGKFHENLMEVLYTTATNIVHNSLFYAVHMGLSLVLLYLKHRVFKVTNQYKITSCATLHESRGLSYIVNILSYTNKKLLHLSAIVDYCMCTNFDQN
jgi:hypothetical protein